MTTTAFNQFRRTLVGRFSMDVLMDMRRVAQQHICGAAVHVEELAWTGDEKDRHDALWRARAATIAAKPPPAGKRTVIIEQRELEPGVLGVLYHASERNPRLLAAAALRDAGLLPVWFMNKGYEGLSQQMVPGLLDVVHAYRARPEGDGALPEPRCFHLERGVVALPFQGKEEANVLFGARPLGLRFRVTTESVDEVKQPGLVERFSRATATWPGGSPFEPVRSGRRTVAGLEGDELVLRGVDEEQGRVKLSWLYLGEVRSGARPKVTLDLESSEERLDEKISAWDHTLDSMRSTEA
jgi:hypothetical protein